MDERQENNLFAVVTGLGAYKMTPEAVKEFTRGEEALECLQEIKKYLRLDHPETAPILSRLADWNIVKSHLVPLISRCQRGEDDKLVYNCLQLLNLLTLAPSPILQADVINQLTMNIQRSKDAFTGSAIWSVLADYMGETLAETPKKREKRDEKTVEMITALMRNVLSMADMPGLSSHDTIIKHLADTHILDILLLMGNNVAEDSLAGSHNLFLLEVTFLLLQYQKPESLLDAMTVDKRVVNERARAMKEKEDETKKKDRQTAQLASRRARMGSMYTMVTKVTGKDAVNHTTVGADLTATTSAGSLKNRTLKHTFLGGYNQLHHGTITSDSAKVAKLKTKARDYEFAQTQKESSTEIRKRLGAYCNEFIQNCHNTLMNSIWRDIRAQRDNVLETDTFNFMWVMHFFLVYHRKSFSKKDLTDKKFSVAELGVVIDTSMYKFLLEKLNEFAANVRAHKDNKTKDLWGWRHTIAMRALHEQIQYITCMEKYGSQDLIDAASSLKQNIIYEHQLIHDCVAMIKAYNPKIHASTFLSEVVGLTHTVIRLFETCVEDQKQVYVKRKSRKKQQKAASTDGATMAQEEDEEDSHNAQVYNELVFDFKKELLEFCHPKVINVYLLLVESYKTNGVMVNHYVTKMLHRIAVGCDLKGLFYRLSVLKTMNMVLSDGSIKKDKEFNELRGFLKFLVASYRMALEKNPFLGLEALFESTRRHAMLFDMGK
ncbi:hypothetical protein SARC_07581 [Sphaeroforma arctica JP610]|uniref:Timeless N-terminal domain-containing protein n=1 Tax=Sphaeroforma arctica JP610 TaxID=667725 RepID=A0A0L0FVT9_9EUKA|nr:hypothetical protein SARC_07581 [Sphaeroforma arctica JP610]KNC80053.1 hypothetical protein SARC_07581 [Sphaeroforma arctica JP610]|eukprot:XP_014153955.1 hypothetical protein SARC_07581 [Sphaeroforma arctica JP610]